MNAQFNVKPRKWLLDLSYRVYDIRVDEFGNTLFLIYYKDKWT